jgi:hypothetical protein
MAGAAWPFGATVGRYDDGRAAGDAGLDALREIASGRLVHARERLIQ